jgi:hypothetical protein
LLGQELSWDLQLSLRHKILAIVGRLYTSTERRHKLSAVMIFKNKQIMDFGEDL